MARLIVNPDTADAWQIELKSGVNLVGRGPENDCLIDHSSVSNSHCQIEVHPGGASLRDAGSIGGTFVNGKMIDEPVALVPGQVIHVGDVAMRYEAEPPNPPVSPTADDANAARPAMCQSHPKAAARYECPTCHGRFCELCVTRRRDAGVVRPFCRRCGAECERAAAFVAPPQGEEESLARSIVPALRYPLTGDGAILLVGGTVFMLVIEFLAAHSSILGLLVLLFGAGYLISYYQRVLLSTAAGERQLPDWPDFTSIADVLPPVLQFIAAVLVSFGPAIMLRAFAPAQATWYPWAMNGAMILGCAYVPLAITAVTMADSIGGVNPLVIIPSILKMPGDYAIALAFSVAIYFASSLGSRYLPGIIPLPFVSGAILEFVGLYLACVEMHVLGRLYRLNEDRLGWFRR